MNEVTNRCNNFNIKDTSEYPYVSFNDIFNLNLNFKKIQEKYEKDDNEL